MQKETVSGKVAGEECGTADVTRLAGDEWQSVLLTE